MAKWNRPEIEELGIEATEHNWTGIYKDGGYVGDGVISGHLSWDKPEEKPAAPTDTPVNSNGTDALS